MTKKIITLLSVASVTAVTLIGLTAINLREPNISFVSYAEPKSLLFDSALASTYMRGGNVYDKKTIPADEDHSDIKIMCLGVKSYGGGQFCYTGENQIGKTLTIIVGVNNLQSASFTFKSNYANVIDPNEIGFNAIAKFHGEKFDFTYPDSSSWSPVIFSHEFESSDVERNVNKTLTWNKTTEVGVARYIQFKFTLVSDTRSSEYVPLNLVSFTLTWSC